MVLVNGIEFITYTLDTDESIKDRIAANMNSVTKYLYFPNGISDNIIVDDILVNIRDRKYEQNIKGLYDVIKDKIQGLDIVNDIIKPWIAYNEYYNDMEEQGFGLAMLENDKNILDDIAGRDLELRSIWNERNIIKNKLDDNIINNQNKVVDHTAIINEFDKIDEGIPYTVLETKEITVLLTLNIRELSILEIFNELQLNRDIPFATSENFYKILKDYIPSLGWSIDEDNVVNNILLLKVSEKEEGMIAYDDFVDVFIEKEKDEIYINFSITIKPCNIDRKGFIKRIFSSITDISVDAIEDEEEESIKVLT